MEKIKIQFIHHDENVDDIWRYNIHESTWNLLSLKLPIKISNFGYVYYEITKNIIICGGQYDIYGIMMNIFIFHQKEIIGVSLLMLL